MDHAYNVGNEFEDPHKDMISP